MAVADDADRRAMHAAGEPEIPRNATNWQRWKHRFTSSTWWHWRYAMVTSMNVTNCALSYLLDYVLIIGLFIVGQVIAARVISPFHRYIPVGSTDIAYPDLPDIVPSWAMIVASTGVPILTFAAYQIWGKSLHDFHHATLGVLEGLGFAVFFTQFAKIYTGEYRPNWLENKSKDGRQAFPMQSGVFLSLWLCGKLGMMKKTGGHVWQQFIVFLPMVGAATIALSRSRDYHHSFADIVGGIVLGASIAIFNYFLKYPPLWKFYCEIPKRRWYIPHLTKEEWAARYAAADQAPRR